MSKNAALAMLTGQPLELTTTVPGLVTSDMPSPTDPVKEPVTPDKVQLESDRFAKLAAREAALVKDREASKLEKLEFEKQKEALKKVQTDIEEFETLKKTDKIAALKKIGFSEEDIFNFMAGKEAPKEKTAAEIATEAAEAATQKLRDEMAEEKTKLETEKTDKAIKAYKEEIGKQIKAEAEKYEYCNHNGEAANELIYQTILGFMNDDNELSPVDAMKEAIEAVEKMYDDEYTKLKLLKKFQPKEEMKVEPAVVPKALPKPAPTLTNKATATVASTTVVTRETPRQKRERLENALRNMGQN